MSLGASLSMVLVAFVALLVTVIVMAFRERKVARALVVEDAQSAAASDARVLTVIFAAIPGGMLLTVLVAWLVFL